MAWWNVDPKASTAKCRRTSVRRLLPTLSFVLVAACAISGQAAPTSPQVAQQSTAAVQPALRSVSQPANDQNAAVAVYQQNGPSVVNITSIAIVPTRQGQLTQPQGVGSGFMLDADGRIVTNNHVVQDADELAVTLQDKSTVLARLVGRDPDNDLAVIQVDPNAADDQGRSIRDRIKPVTLADSDQP
jgi:S1-C subfamily serine protease